MRVSSQPLNVRGEPMHRLAISFSGGETSAYMTNLLWTSNEVRAHYSDIVIQFANTGQENEQTLWFVDACARRFGWPVVWVEADVDPARRGVRHRVVNFDTASRDGAPFEAVIAKFGIPNSKFKHCTRSLKQHPMQSYLRSLGWEPGSYDTAIGIRADEFDRCSATAKEQRLVYPLVTRWPATKPQINAWWAAQPFLLALKGYQGNCRWCWKKSYRKHLTILNETPEAYAFPERMEREYGLTGPEFAKDPPPAPDYRRVFFRGNKTVADLREMLAEAQRTGPFAPATNDAAWFDPTLDGSEGGCGEACEVFGDDPDAPSLAEMLS